MGKGHKLAVVGLGGLGHMGVKFGVAFGAEVTVLSTSPSKEKDAKKLGAHHFLVTTDPAQVEAAKNTFDFILDTVSAEHDINMYMSMLKTDGTHICVGVPPKPTPIRAFSLLNGRKSLSGSGIGGIAETQEMLDYCAAHNIVSDIEMIDIKDITPSYARMLKGMSGTGLSSISPRFNLLLPPCGQLLFSKTVQRICKCYIRHSFEMRVTCSASRSMACSSSVKKGVPTRRLVRRGAAWSHPVFDHGYKVEYQPI